MLKSILAVFLVLSLSVSAIDVSRFINDPIGEEDIEELFALYIMHTAAVRLEPSVERYMYFRSQVLEIIAHNRDPKQTWKRTITKFTGITMQEMEGTAIMAPQHCSATNGVKAQGNIDAPAFLDWRQSGIVTPVKNQGSCGSCWTFSATGALEAHWALYKNRTSPLLSEQQLVDCAGDFNNFGCSGGLPSQAFEYIRQVGGIQTEIDYPYKATNGTCAFDKNRIAASVFYGSANVSQADENALLEALVQRGPVSIAFQVIAGFKDYDGGVYVGESCFTDPDHVNHAVLLVGHGYDEGTKLNYWIVKNSWGLAWGESGYFRIKRGVNMCGVATCASYPQLRPN